jgi:hypothetical protein
MRSDLKAEPSSTRSPVVHADWMLQDHHLLLQRPISFIFKFLRLIFAIVFDRYDLFNSQAVKHSSIWWLWLLSLCRTEAVNDF